MENITFVCSDAKNQLKEWFEMGVMANVLIIDPPRKGCDQELLASIVNMSVEKIIYVSCNPATLAMDIKYLLNNNYQIMEVQPIDMFPQTTDVETVVLITRVKD